MNLGVQAEAGDPCQVTGFVTEGALGSGRKMGKEREVSPRIN